MTDTNGATVEQVAEQRDAFVGRLFQALLDTMDLSTVYIGDRLGLYRVLSDGGPATPIELSARTGTHARYVREWLEQQAVTGILAVDDAAADPSARRYRLPPGHAEVLLDPDSLSHLAFFGRYAACIGRRLPDVVDAFRTGVGIPWRDYGADAREAQAQQNRPVFLQLLGNEWLPAIPDVHARLQREGPGHVADVACGAGWSSIAIARAYPTVQVDGFDTDEAVIELARANAAAAGVQDRVHFHARDASDPALAGRYDLAIICESLHDFPRPVEALRSMRGLLGEGASVLVVDERVAETFTAPGDELERLFYGFSVVC